VVTSRLAPVLVLLLAFAGCAASRPGAAGAAAGHVLTAPDGQASSLAALAAGRDATVLVFWSGTCPCVRRYQERVDALLDAYPPPRVAVIGVSSNAGESFAEALRVARERGVRIPILRDEGGEVARALGVQSTPTVVVLDRAGRTRFVGWVDNERLPGEPGREPWLERALRGVLDGHGAFAARTPVYGCTITRALFRAEQGACCTVH
jgi:peroxiredoxin